MQQDVITIAIDGPAASGKGTLARRIAQRYGLNHLDTGLSYRAVAKALLDAGQPLEDEEAAVAAAKAVDLSKADPEVLSANEIGEAASKVAVISAVRRVLVEKQRAFAQTPPGAVLDGRDIGTVVCPDADVKIYLTADAKVRAERRWREIVAKGGNVEFAAILADIEQRDRRDMNRVDSPLKPADDAHLLDSSKMDIDSAFLAACGIIDNALASRK
ncbi:(d)CMP kinase [Chelativorans composti]|uniref:Cytidylate kinase n=1 Tax=Chelativorans composti TaxID=768533 RepID=A0ABW5DFZ5_9HYPH